MRLAYARQFLALTNGFIKVNKVNQIETNKDKHLPMKMLFRLLVIAFMLAGCEAKTDWPLQTVIHDFIVVDATITDENMIQVVQLSHPVDKLNEIPLPVTGAVVILTLPDALYKFHELPASPGKYVSNVAFAGKKNKIHSLQVALGSNIYTAKANMEPGALFSLLNYARDKQTGLYHISKVYANAFNPSRPAMFEVLLDWSNVPGYQNKNPDSCKSRQLYYVLPTLDVSQVFAPAAEQVNFPSGTIIQEKRYSLTPEHAEFIRELLSETTWQGGLFNSAAANIPTNLSQGAVGYFSACAVTTLTAVAKP